MSDERDLCAYDGQSKTAKQIAKYNWRNNMTENLEIILHR